MTEKTRMQQNDIAQNALNVERHLKKKGVLFVAKALCERGAVQNPNPPPPPPPPLAPSC